MTWDVRSQCFHFTLELGMAAEESFQIVVDGSSPTQFVHPMIAHAHFHDQVRVQTGPYGERFFWTVGRHALDEGAPGRKYDVYLHVMSKSDGKIPTRVEWVRVETAN